MGSARSARRNAGGEDELVSIVSVLARDVEKLESLIRTHRPNVVRAGQGAAPDREQAREQWTRIRARAVEIVSHARETLETVRKESSA